MHTINHPTNNNFLTIPAGIVSNLFETKSGGFWWIVAIRYDDTMYIGRSIQGCPSHYKCMYDVFVGQKHGSWGFLSGHGVDPKILGGVNCDDADLVFDIRLGWIKCSLMKSFHFHLLLMTSQPGPWISSKCFSSKYVIFCYMGLELFLHFIIENSRGKF